MKPVTPLLESNFNPHLTICRENHFVQDFSNYTEDEFEWFFYSKMDHIIIGIVMPIILSFGLLGNALFIFTTFRVKSMRTITNFYLINLATADACYLTFGIGEKLACLYTSTVHSDVSAFGITWCMVVFPLSRMCAFASLFLVTLVTLDKYHAICRPLKHRIRTSPSRSHTKYVILGAWTTAFCVAATTIPASSRFITSCVVYPDKETYAEHPIVVNYCFPARLWVTSVVNGIQTLPFFFALFPNFFMYFQIIRRLSDRVVGRNIPQFVRNGTKMRNAVAKMLVLNGLVFFLCNMPFYAVSLMYMLLYFASSSVRERWQEGLQSVQPYIQLLLYVNSAVNPYIYDVVNKTYRKSLYQAFQCGSHSQAVKKYEARRTTSSGVHVTTEIRSAETHI
ncbi:Somatostatin receptor type 4 [Holothuria leucospilota]|uniref:Somatostatin receptor type 4 n=1 Tax=Holothuria leucospilota TaxID=206669 RepID=A0A9Q1CFC2_HOLLE|nr:Somatostatin receptor type 4 [Holothuria leucospilota]